MEKKGYGTGKRTKRDIGKSLMVINIKQEIIDILQIANRCFMYNPKIGILILGDEMYGKTFAVLIRKSSMFQKRTDTSMIICVGG